MIDWSPDRRNLLTVSLSAAAYSKQSAAGQIDRPELVDPRWFGARCDGTTDDSAAVQAAVDACLKQGPTSAMMLSGPCAIARPIMIDRPVDASGGRLRIVGVGGNAGLRALKPMTMLQTRLTQGDAPASEFVSFEDLYFSAPRGADVSVLSGSFLRILFRGCDFEAVTLCASTTYLQEWTLEQCIAYRWRGTFVRAHGAFAFRSVGNKFQHGDEVYRLDDPTGHTGFAGCSLERDVVESCSGGYLRATFTRAVQVSGLYAEGNAGTLIALNEAQLGQNVTISNCLFVPQDQRRLDPTIFAIKWGHTQNGTSTGNWSGGSLHDDRQAVGQVVSQGDYVERGALFASTPVARG